MLELRPSDKISDVMISLCLQLYGSPLAPHGFIPLLWGKPADEGKWRRWYLLRCIAGYTNANANPRATNAVDTHHNHREQSRSSPT